MAGEGGSDGRARGDCAEPGSLREGQASRMGRCVSFFRPGWGTDLPRAARSPGRAPTLAD